MQAVILAGGKGVRLRPYTVCLPKPLLPIDDIPILEVVLRQLKYFGVTDVVLSLNYLADLLMAYFGDGKKLGLNISYSIEDKVLGTVGPLSIIDGLQDNFLVMNGDLLTTLNFKDMFRYHVNNGNDASIAVYSKEVKIDLGVISSENGVFLNYIEKPTYYFDVSMGIYVFNKRVLDFIPTNNKMDLPDLIMMLKYFGKKISCYYGDHDWIDIGRFDDFEKATAVFRERRSEYLPDEESAIFGVK